MVGEFMRMHTIISKEKRESEREREREREETH